MCMSVPQIAVLRMRISTSFGPIVGFSTSAIQIPGSALAFTSAFIANSCSIRSGKCAELAPGGAKGSYGLVELRAAVGRRHLRANAGLAMRNHGKRETDDAHAELE